MSAGLLDVGKRLYLEAWMNVHQKRLLDTGKIEKLVTALRSLHPTNPDVAEKIRTEADYLERKAPLCRLGRH